jgi:hypothetical protein
MSAFIVPDYHINALVSWAAERHGLNAVSYYWGGRRREVRGDEKRIASVLYAENVRSVNARYREADAAHGFKFKRVPNRLNPIDVVKACHGYGYQACEANGWEQSEAFAIIAAITQSAIRAVPGYSESNAWVLSDPNFSQKEAA